VDSVSLKETEDEVVLVGVQSLFRFLHTYKVFKTLQEGQNLAGGAKPCKKMANVLPFQI
jgi:hypothetical protein